MRALFLVVSALVAFACGTMNLLPDGGRPRQVCSGTKGVVPVQVVNGQDQPIEAVDVTATHAGTGMVVSGKTNANGISDIVDAELGTGVIHVVAQLGAKQVAADVSITCGECICSATPSTVTLKLQ